jgi:F-type H+-transporting ATPase subunit b
MQIDWLTVSAQIVNFLVLVWLLQHFLYGPITRAMAAREERIQNRVAEAREARDQAEAEAERLRAQQRELDEAREEKLAQAKAAASETRRALERDARAEVEQKRQAWLDQLEDERAQFLAELRRRSSDAFYTLARRALVDLADADLEERIAEGFLGQLKGLDDAARGQIAAAGRATVRSRFELSAGAKRKLTKAIHDLLGDELEVDYAADGGVAAGIVLEAGSRHVAWTLESWLDGLEAEVRDRLDSVPDTAAAEARRAEAEAEA